MFTRSRTQEAPAKSIASLFFNIIEGVPALCTLSSSVTRHQFLSEELLRCITLDIFKLPKKKKEKGLGLLDK